MKYHSALCIAAAILAIVAGCGKGHSKAKAASANNLTGLDSKEIDQINSLRTQNVAGPGSSSDVAESASANESAAFHAGFLASMTATSQASTDGTIENVDSLPLATDTGAAIQTPENRLKIHSSGALPTQDDDVAEYYLQFANDYAPTDGFVTDAGGSPSRILTMWHSRIGRRLLERNQLSLLGFGSIVQAQTMDLRVPIPPNNTFLNGELSGAFVLIYNTVLPRDKPGIWPGSATKDDAFEVRRFSTDDDGTGCPISVHASVPITALDKFKLEVWNGSSFGWTGGPAAFTLWGASDVSGSTTLTNVTLSFSQDDDYLDSEIYLVPVAPLPVGLYRMEIQINGNASLIRAESFFSIVP